jgi:sigma-B regulation protein RsbU (phosphoserine phosphatase)
MAALIDNVMDFARGRLGSGLPLERSSAGNLEPLLRHVIAELQTSAPDRVIDIRIAVTESVDCDRGRIGQLVSNLVGNAIDHGAPDEPIQVSAATQDGWFELSVTNAGEEIPPASLEHISTPTREAPQAESSRFRIGSVHLKRDCEGARGHPRCNIDERSNQFHVSDAISSV